MKKDAGGRCHCCMQILDTATMAVYEKNLNEMTSSPTDEFSKAVLDETARIAAELREELRGVMAVESMLLSTEAELDKSVQLVEELTQKYDCNNLWSESS